MAILHSKKLKSAFSWLVCHEIWPTGLGVILATASLHLAPWGLGLLALLWLVRWWVQGYWCLPTPVNFLIILLLVMGGIAGMVTIDREATSLALSRLLAGVALLYSVIHWCRNRKQLKVLVWGITLSAFVLALLTPFVIPWRQMLVGDYIENVYLSHSLLNPNMVAGTLGMLLPFPVMGSIFAVQNYVSRKRIAKSGALWKVFVPDNVSGVSLCLSLLTTWGGLCALWLTQSRGSWLALGSVLFLISLRHNRVLRFLGLFLLLLVSGFMLQGQVLVFLDALGTGGVIAGWSERVEIWSRAVYIIQYFPFTGSGANTYPEMVALLSPLFPIAPERVIPHAHNLYLQVAIDLGLPGLVTFLAILFVVFGCALPCFKCSSDRVFMVSVWAGTASLIVMLIHGVVDATTWIVGWGAPMPWLVMGTLIAASRQVERRVV